MRDPDKLDIRTIDGEATLMDENGNATDIKGAKSIKNYIRNTLDVSVINGEVVVMDRHGEPTHIRGIKLLGSISLERLKPRAAGFKRMSIVILSLMIFELFKNCPMRNKTC